MLVRLQQIVKTYPSSAHTVAAVQNVDLQIAEGEFVAICGPSGCGKSTLLLVAGGLLRPDAGEVEVAGTKLYDLSPTERASFRAKQIGFVFQQFHLVPYLSVYDNVMCAQLGVARNGSTDAASRAESLIEQFGLSERASHRPGQLSTGERQRTALARALLNEPQVLLADEPTGNLDRENADSVLDYLRAFADHGGAVMLVTHDDQAAAAADRTVRIENGAVAK